MTVYLAQLEPYLKCSKLIPHSSMSQYVTMCSNEEIRYVLIAKLNDSTLLHKCHFF